jgi:hypothetical protein
MLYGKSTPKYAGITIYGEYYDLRNLYDVAQYLAKAPYLVPRFHEFLQGFCYDIRHAYQGERIVDKREELHDASSTYFGVHIVWPLMPIYIKILRHCAAFMPTPRMHQGYLYLLDNVVLHALLSAKAEVADRVIAWIDHYPMFSENYYTDYFNEICKAYLFKTKPGITRLARLPQMLQMLSPLSEDYRDFAEKLEQTAKDRGCDPQSLMDMSDWPEYEW